MPVISFLSFSQPYVLTEIIGLPPEQHGQVTGLLITMHEIVVLAPGQLRGRACPTGSAAAPSTRRAR